MMRPFSVRWCLWFLLLMAVAAAAEVPVAFLSKPPVIDGILDDSLRALPVQHFTAIEHVGSDNSAAARPTYRIAYGAAFLYLYIEVPGAEVVARDRSYQNGDGLQLAIARPREGDVPTDEFYVLGFTTAARASTPWQKQFVWYRNVDLSFKRLRSAQLATAPLNGHTAIELLLPWAEVYPYHPWLSDAIGFNLCYVKASGETAKTYYFVVQDDHLQQEQSPRRYTRLRFAAPEIAEGVQTYAVLNQNHVDAGQPVNARVAVAARSGESSFEAVARVLSGEGTQVAFKREKIATARGVRVHDFSLPVSQLPAGGYTVTFDVPVQAAVPLGLSVVPAYDVSRLRSRLENVSHKISAGSVTTLNFQLDELENARRRLKPYDIATDLRLAAADFVETLRAAEQGSDLIAQRTGIQRRAYRSNVDGTLQPYSVRVPVLEKGKRYPLFVFLHGSGEDDRGALRDVPWADRFIQLAPRGRGTSNAYSADHAQDDIREAIEDVIANYPVDPKRIVLAGFSMGGYGVYRTFFEDPRRYRALAVFSGHPTIGREMIGKEQPSFLEQEYLGVFRGTPIFIFHGGKDRNCPIELTRELVTKLKDAGATVEFHDVADKGHEAPPPEVDVAFRSWLERVVASD